MFLKDKNIDVSYTKIYNLLTVKNGILSPKAKKITKKEIKSFTNSQISNYEKRYDKIITLSKEEKKL